MSDRFRENPQYQRYVFHYRKKNGQPLGFNAQHDRLVPLRVWFADTTVGWQMKPEVNRGSKEDNYEMEEPGTLLLAVSA